MPKYTGALHVHSAFSDGNLSLDQIADMARSQALDFIVLGEHANDLAPDEITSIARNCEALSGDGLLVVPGLEFELEGRHVIALGPEKLLRELEPAVVVNEPRKARAQGGVTIWAHPAVTFAWTLSKPLLLDYDGWEVWNRRAEGALPSLLLLGMLRKAMAEGRPLKALAGTDFHDGQRIPEPFVVVDGPPQLTATMLLEALRSGSYEIRGSTRYGECTIGPDGSVRPIGPALRLSSMMRYVLVRMRCVLALARHACLSALGLR